jgi:hypothetical protein
VNRSERASRIWAVLAWSVSHRQNITYSQLAQASRAFTAGLGQVLEPIQSYCLLNDLPLLTILVVQQESGLPGTSQGIRLQLAGAREPRRGTLGPCRKATAFQRQQRRQPAMSGPRARRFPPVKR